MTLLTTIRGLVVSASGAGLDSSQVTTIASDAGLTVYTALDSLPTSSLSVGDQAYVSENQRMYISNGSGWYNMAAINSTPHWLTEPNASYSVADSATPLTVVAKAGDSDNSNLNLIHQSIASDSAAFLVDITRDSSVYTFTPKSESTVIASVTAGDLTDSGQNDFIYTFKWSDGINFVSKAVNIAYNFVNLDPFGVFNTSSMPHSEVNTQEMGSNKISGNGASAWSIFNKNNSMFGGHDGHDGASDYPAYIAIDLGEVKPINRLNIHIHQNSFGYFELQGSNNAGSGTFYNAGTWTSLPFSTSSLAQGNQNAGGASSALGEGTSLVYQYNNDTAYRYYRLKILDNSKQTESVGTRQSGWAIYYWELYRA